MSQSWRKMRLDLPQDPVILLLGIYPIYASTYHRDTSSTMLIAALFIRAKNWKLLNSFNIRINKTSVAYLYSEKEKERNHELYRKMDRNSNIYIY